MFSQKNPGKVVYPTADEALPLETAMCSMESKNKMLVMVFADLAGICKKLAVNSAVPENLRVRACESVEEFDAPQKLSLPKVINLLTDLKEEREVTIQNEWVLYPMMKIVNDFEESMKNPPIKMGTRSVPAGK